MVERTVPRLGQARLGLALFMLLLLAGMWVLEFLDQLSGHQLDQLGIHAREVDGLLEILTAPFLHAGWDHLISNSLPFFVLGFLVLLSGLARWLVSSLIIIVSSGMTAWFLTPIHTIILGASGLIFGSAHVPVGSRHLVPTSSTSGSSPARIAGIRRTDLGRHTRQRGYQLASPPRRGRRRGTGGLGVASAGQPPPAGDLRDSTSLLSTPALSFGTPQRSEIRPGRGSGHNPACRWSRSEPRQ